MQWTSALSQRQDLTAAVEECALQIDRDLGGQRPDLVVVFVSQEHRESYDELPRLLAPLRAGSVIGCSAGGVIGGGHEVEQHPAVSLTGAILPGVRIGELSVVAESWPDAAAGRDAWVAALGLEEEPSEGLVVLADPFSLDADALLAGLNAALRGIPVVGGLASGGREPGSNFLLVGDEIRDSGAVGVGFRGNLQLDTVVAQGCRPIGLPMFVTRCQRNVIQGLDGENPYEVVKGLFERLPRRDQDLLQHSLFLGVVMRPEQQEYRHGDFLIRNLIGFDREHGFLAAATLLEEQQVVQFHLRDALTSHEDLEAHLRAYTEQLGEQRPAGALLFSCLGRGQHLYGDPDHDTRVFEQHLGSLPLAGFFCNGEIGPVQGRTFLHGYTSSFGLFRPKSQS